MFTWFYTTEKWIAINNILFVKHFSLLLLLTKQRGSGNRSVTLEEYSGGYLIDSN